MCKSVRVVFPVTPQDYQPPGFREAEGDVLEFEKEPVKLTMGEVTTPFHCVKFDMATEKHRLEQVRLLHRNTQCAELVLHQHDNISFSRWRRASLWRTSGS